MEAYCFLGLMFLGFLISFSWQFDVVAGKRFMNTELPPDSFFRKLLPKKEDPLDPYLYVKVIPFFINVLIFLAVFILYIVYWIKPELLYDFLVSKYTVIGSGIYAGVNFVYLIIMRV